MQRSSVKSNLQTPARADGDVVPPAALSIATQLLGMASSKALLLKSLKSSWVNKRHFQEGESTVSSWNLRKAPSGPAPLLHNGKKHA